MDTITSTSDDMTGKGGPACYVVLLKTTEKSRADTLAVKLEYALTTDVWRTRKKRVMLLYILNIVTPVFVLLLAGYVSVKAGVLSLDVIDGLMKFCTHIAIPCLLFRATSTVDLGTAYDWQTIISYYVTASICFGLAITVARKHFFRRPGEAVAVGFSALYSNLLMVGLPIVDRAFGEQAASTTIAVVSLNAPVCYLLGIVVMESVRADGRSYRATAAIVVKAMFKNTLMIGIALGFLVNFSGFELPQFLSIPVDMMTSAALPCALFGLGGLLARYALAEQLAESSVLSGVSLILSPIIAFLICTLFGVPETSRNVVVLLAAIPPGLNAYLFASLYSRGLRTASSNVLIGTVLSVFSISFWLWMLLALG